MASRENSKADSKTASELELLNEEFSTRAIASLPWNEQPLCWFTPEQQSKLRERAEILHQKLGEKIWSLESIGYQFLIVSGKVRLRSEGESKPLATLEKGDWFGNLKKYPYDCKAVAASKEVVVVRWQTALWTELSTKQIEEFWLDGEEAEEKGREVERERGRIKISPTPLLPHSPTPPLLHSRLTHLSLTGTRRRRV